MKSLGTIGLILICACNAVSDEYRVYCGTYTGPESKGIYVADFNAVSGALSDARLAVETRDPSFLALHPSGDFLYAVGEVTDVQGQRAGAVNAYAFDRSSGRLDALNQQGTGGAGPCHLAVDATGGCLLVANYGSGSIAALPVHADGHLGEAATVIQHTGSGTNPARQAGPHAHYITSSPDNRFALACDLGLDKVLVYEMNPATAKLTINDPPYAALAHGAGPRHLAFHPNGMFVYVINELALTITLFNYDALKGVLSKQQTVSTVPSDYTATQRDSTAEVAVHPNGRFVYGSNRGSDSIAVFSVDLATGRLTPVQHEPTQGKTPRHFAIDPTGRWLLAENQNSDSVVLFALDPKSGKLEPTGRQIAIGSPVCALFVKKP